MRGALREVVSSPLVQFLSHWAAHIILLAIATKKLSVTKLEAK